jgi:phosphoglycerate dehydrogenase-like enzyme
MTGAVFINIGRSNVAGEADILEALERGWLREAVLDVFDKEPLPAGHPFWFHKTFSFIIFSEMLVYFLNGQITVFVGQMHF